MKTTAPTAPRMWDAEIDIAREQDDWMDFETQIHQSPAWRARVARSLDRYGLGTSDIAVDEALDYLTNIELGQSARYFNQTGKAPDRTPLRRDTRTIMAAIIGTATMPLMTAVQNNAFTGLIPAKLISMPTNVETAISQ